MNNNAHDVRIDSRYRYLESPFVMDICIQNSLSKRNKRKKNKRYDNNTYPTTCCSTNIYFLHIAWIEYFKSLLISLSKTSCSYFLPRSMKLYCVVCIIQLLYYPREEYNGCITFIEMWPILWSTQKPSKSI